MASGEPGSKRTGTPGFSLLWRMNRTLAFVWRSGPGWTIANASVILLSAALPMVFLYVIKLLIDLITEAMAGGAPPDGVVELGPRSLVCYVARDEL